MIRKHNLEAFFICFAGFLFAGGFVHPVTPLFFQVNNFSSSMFGIAFAAMSFGSFFFSPVIGKLGDKLGYTKGVTIAILMYAASTPMFLYARSNLSIIIARIIGGAAGGFLFVNGMAYILSLDMPNEDKNKCFILMSCIQTVANSFGFLFGGIVGDIKMEYAFYAQIIVLLLFVPLSFKIKESPDFKKDTSKLDFNKINPFSSIINCSKILNVTLAVFLFSVLVAMTGSVGFDQNFSYFQKVNLDFSSSAIGTFKAVVGIISLTCNMTINMWLIRRTNISKSMSLFLVIGGVGILTMVLTDNFIVMLVSSLVYYGCYAVYYPLQQAVLVNNSKTSNATEGDISALFNTTKSLGQIIGPLFAGFVFDINPNYAFVTFGICLIVSATFGMINYKQLQRQK